MTAETRQRGSRRDEDEGTAPASGGARDSPRRLIGWTIAVVSALVLGVWLLVRLLDIVLLIYVSTLFAMGFSALIRFLDRHRARTIGRRRLPRWLVVLAVYVTVLAGIAGLATAVIPPLVQQAQDLAKDGPRLVEQGQRFLVERGLLHETVTLREALQRSSFAGTDAVGTVLGALWGVLGGLVGLVTILILTFYFVVESDDIFRTAVRLVSAPRRPRVSAVVSEIGRKVSAWLGGQFLLSGIIGASTATVLGLMGVPYFIVLAVISAIGEMIPVIGPFLAAIPAVLVALSVSWKLALFVAGFFLVQQQLENHLLVPKLMERQLGISPVTVIIALLVGSALLGVVGALLAIPTAAIIQVLVQEMVLREPASGDASARARSST
jgi:predicted PurR-regulated permease PerM